MVQVQGGQNTSYTKSRTKEAEGLTLRDLWSTYLKEADNQLDVGKWEEERVEVTVGGSGKHFI